MYLFIVDLNETATYKMCFVGVCFGDCYYLTECAWDDATRLLVVIAAHHCVGFTTTCLSIGKDCPVVAIED